MTYHGRMARGWESKSVEEQQSVSGAEAVAENGIKAGIERAQRERKKQELELQKEHILSSRTSNPARRAALEAALADIESRLSLLN